MSYRLIKILRKDGTVKEVKINANSFKKRLLLTIMIIIFPHRLFLKRIEEFYLKRK